MRQINSHATGITQNPPGGVSSSSKTTPGLPSPSNNNDNKPSRLKEIFTPLAKGWEFFSEKIWNNKWIEGGLIAGTVGLFGSTLLMGSSFLTSPALLAGTALLALIKTSDIVSNRAESIGSKLGLSPMMIGIALGMITSLPELGVSMAGMLNGSPGIALGNGIGSNIANVGLIMGLSALIKPLHSNDKNWWYDSAALGLSTAFLAGNLALSSLGMFSGVTMIGMLGAYFGGQYLLNRAKKNKEKADGKEHSTEASMKESFEEKTGAKGKRKAGMLKDILWGSAAIAGLIGSASLLVTGGTAVAASLGVSQGLIALFAFAIGTSLPELMVSLQAVRKGNTGLAIGNVLGSNIFNNLFVIGATNLMSSILHNGIKIPTDFSWANKLGFVNNLAYSMSAILPASFLAYNKFKHGKEGYIGRWQGAALAGLYGAFAAAVYTLGGVTPEQASAVEGAKAAAASSAVTPPPPV